MSEQETKKVRVFNEDWFPKEYETRVTCPHCNVEKYVSCRVIRERLEFRCSSCNGKFDVLTERMDIKEWLIRVST